MRNEEIGIFSRSSHSKENSNLDVVGVSSLAGDVLFIFLRVIERLSSRSEQQPGGGGAGTPGFLESGTSETRNYLKNGDNSLVVVDPRTEQENLEDDYLRR